MPSPSPPALIATFGNLSEPNVNEPFARVGATTINASFAPKNLNFGT